MHSPLRFASLLLTVPALLAAPGCATSLQPLGTADVRTDVAGIAGEWTVERSLFQGLSSEARIRVHRRGAGMYDFAITQKDETTTWDADAVQLGRTVFADLFPHFEPDGEKPQDLLLIATHVFFVMESEGETLKFYGFDHARLDPLAVKEKLVMTSPDKHRIIFDADSKKLQQFFEEHGPALRQKDPAIILKKKP